MISTIHFERISSQYDASSCYFINHQRWQIRCYFELEEGNLFFLLKDSFGLEYITSEYAVEDVDILFAESLIPLDAKTQRQIIYDYLESLLQKASSYQIHVDRIGSRYIVRFGNYGLKGGVKNGWGLLFSLGQVGCGIILQCTGTAPFRRSGRLLIATGVCSGVYAYREEERFSWRDYAKQMGYGALSGLVSSGFAYFAENAGTINRIGFKALEGIVESTLLTSVSELLEKRQFVDFKKLASEACFAGIAKSGGALAYLAVSIPMNRIIDQIKSEMKVGLVYVLRDTIASFANVVGIRAITNACQGREIRDELFQPAALNAIISGCVATGQLLNALRIITETKKIGEDAVNFKEQLDQVKKSKEALKARVERVRLLREKESITPSEQNELAEVSPKNLE